MPAAWTNFSTSGDTAAPAVGKKFARSKPNVLRSNFITVLSYNLYCKVKAIGAFFPFDL